MGFMASKTLLSAVELELFTRLGDDALTGEQIRNALGLHPRGITDFLDCLVALRLLDRDGAGPNARTATPWRRARSSTSRAPGISVEFSRCATHDCSAVGTT